MMDMIKEMEQYLEFCKYRKELNNNTLKAYRIDLRQYLSFIQKDIYLRSNEGRIPHVPKVPTTVSCPKKAQIV